MCATTSCTVHPAQPLGARQSASPSPAQISSNAARSASSASVATVIANPPALYALSPGGQHSRAPGRTSAISSDEIEEVLQFVIERIERRIALVNRIGGRTEVDGIRDFGTADPCSEVTRSSIKIAGELHGLKRPAAAVDLKPQLRVGSVDGPNPPRAP